MKLLIATLLSLGLVAPGTSWGQDAPPAGDAETDATQGAEAAPKPPPAPKPQISPELRKKLRDEIRAELEADMRTALARQEEDLRAEIRAAVAASVAAEEWEPEKWEIEEETQLDFFELDGYFRMRMDLFHNFDLNAGEDVNDAPLFPRPGWDPDASDTLAGANQRLRLMPILNISQDIKIQATIDVLDNLVWGQTPDAFPLNLSTQTSPMLAFTGTEAEPIAGQNATFNSISVKRVWAEVMTPVGQLRFGRVGSHWGLGVLANDGNGLDDDHGDTTDRLMFVTKIADHYIVPAIDTPATGPILRQKDTYQGQPFDLEQRDDVQQYVLAVARRDTDEDIQKMLVDGKPVFNYGMYNVLRIQNIDTKVPSITQRGELGSSDFVLRDAKAWIPDIWLRLHMGKLRVELEAVAILGRIGNGELLSDPRAEPDFSFCKNDTTAPDSHLDICQWGLVVQADYKLNDDRLVLGFEVGAASGDSAPGMGIVATPGGRSQPPDAGSIDGKQFNLDPALGEIDHSINNFKFDADYDVDLILWQQIFGQVTDALYLKPSLAWEVTQSLGIDVAVIYSRALFASSTPGPKSDLGLEIDGRVRYRASDGFIALIEYGIFWPMAGLNIANIKPEIAQTVQGAFAIEF